METTINPRQSRGREIAKSIQLKRQNGVWLVPSQTKSTKYVVDFKNKRCTCPDFEFRRQKCKHIFAVEYRYEWELLDELSQKEAIEQPSRPATPRKTYRQNWKAYNKSQTEEKGVFLALLASLCKGIGEPSQTCGKPRLPLEDMLFACVFKVYSTFSGRRFISDLAGAQDKGFISTLPHFNSVLRYFDKEMLTPYLQMLIEESSLPLTALEENFAIDASGLSATHGFSWHFAKFEEPRLMAKRDWVKIHICTGVKTNVVTAVRVSSKFENDHAFFKPLVEDTRQNFQMRTVSADKAYLSKHNLNVAAMNDAVPFIAFKSNNVPMKRENTVWNKMYHFFALHQEKFLKEYHRRSNVESTFAMIKAKFNGSVRAKNKTSQMNEALCKILAHNICCLIQSMNEFGIEADFWKDAEIH